MEAAENALKHELGGGGSCADDHQFVVEISSGSAETSKVKNGSRVLHELSVLSSPAGISRSRLSPQRPSAAGHTPIPNYETALRRRRRRSLYPSNKPGSRLVEPPHPRKAKVSDQDFETIPLTATMGSTGGEVHVGADHDDDDDDVHVDVDDEVYMTASGARSPDDGKKHGKKVKFLILMEWITFFSMLGVLIASLCINKLKDYYILGLNTWKWCLLILIVFCGLTQWLMDVLEFFIKRNFLLKKKVLYFLYGVKRSVRVFVWLGLILLTWVLLINRSSRRTTTTTRVLNYVTRGIGCCLLAAFLWMFKDFLVKLLAASFHVNTFFERIQESIFHQYVLQVLSSGVQYHQHHPSGTNINKGKLRIKQSKKKNSGEEEVIQVDKLNKVKKEKVSAWTMGGLIKTISSSGVISYF